MQQKEANSFLFALICDKIHHAPTPDAEPDGPPPHGSRRSGSAAGYDEPRKQGKKQWFLPLLPWIIILVVDTAKRSGIYITF